MPIQPTTRTSSSAPAAMFAVVSAVPGRVRVRLTDPRSPAAWLKLLAKQLAHLVAVEEVHIVADARSLIVRYDRALRSLQSLLDDIQAGASAPIGPHEEHATGHRKHAPVTSIGASASHNGASSRHFHEPVRAGDVPSTPQYSTATMLVPTAALAIAAIEVVPAGLAVVAIAASAVPIAARAIDNLRRRRFAVDEIDLLNVALGTAQGAYLPSAAISWMVHLGAVMRGGAVSHAVHKHHTAKITAAQHHIKHRPPERTAELIENALVNDTEFEGASKRTKAKLTAPFIGAAAVMTLFTQDLGMIVGVLKPLYDYATAMRFGTPTILMNAMSHAAHHGPVFTSSKAMENLAKSDALVLFTTAGFADRHRLRHRVERFLHRGVHRIVVPTREEAQDLAKMAVRRGYTHAIIEALPADPKQIVEELIHQGHTVSVIYGAEHDHAWIAAAQVKISLPDVGAKNGSGDIHLAYADLRGLPHAIDVSRHAMLLARQNRVVATAAAGINLSLAFVPPVAATFVSTVATALQASNSHRRMTEESEAQAEAEAVTGVEAPQSPAATQDSPTDGA
jgi:cation transport ATPase